MLGPQQAGILSVRITFLLLLLMFIEPVAVQKQSRATRELTAPYEDFFKNSLVITPKFTGLDCNFGQDRDCLWTWDADNFTEASSGSAVLPGQNGFYRTNAEEVADFHYASSKNFFGPTSDPNGSKKGFFLYLLGRPMSDVANFTDKRLISSLIRESGNNCTVEIKLMYQNVRGAIIEFGTQNTAKAYSPIADIIFTETNETAKEWKSFFVRYGRYIDPFSISIDFKRSRKSLSRSFLAIDDIRLVNCEPESSIPIDCSKSPSRNYNCPGGLGSPCLDGPSMLCDLKPDCPNGGDEKEEICFLMPPGSRCDFNKENDFCGWRDPNHYSLGRSDNSEHYGSRGPFRVAAWQQKKGKTNLDGIRGDLSQKNDGNYLYVAYESGQNGVPGYGATLRSPVFPPPPAYNNNNSSEFYKSCRIRLSYHTLSSSLTPGPLDLVVNFVNETSDGKQTIRQIHLTLDVPMRNNRDGWIRWEAALPPYMQLRYYFNLIGSNGFGAQAELAVDDLSLSPQCFGLGVPHEVIGSWRYNMTDLELCQYYDREDCIPPKKTYGLEFSTCNTFGPLGPMQEDCNKDYAGSSTNVLIGDDSKTSQDSHQLGYVTGIQRWNVPVSGIYTLIASGASGARGRDNKMQSHADEIRALIRLEANETIFILVGQMGSSCEGGQCRGAAFGDHRHKRSVDKEEFFYDLLQDEASEEVEPDGGEEEDNMYGHIIFTPHLASDAKPTRSRRSVPAMMPARNGETRRSEGGKQLRGDSIKEIARIMALSDGSTLPSTRLEPGEEERLVDIGSEEIQSHVPQQQQPGDNQHGRVHQSPDTMEHLEDLSSTDQADFYEGGGGGGGATFIFRFVANGTVQPLLIAAGGGGSSDQVSSSTSTEKHNARGLVNPWLTMESLLKLVSKYDADAGSGGGWSSNLSYPCNFSVVYSESYLKSNKTQSTGFSMSDSWMGGLPCSANSQQWGGFGGGGAGCHGGGGGGGYIGGLGGIDRFSNGEGGWSYYNPDAVLKVLDARMNPIHSVVHLAATGNQANPTASLPQLWSNQGQGQVHILPPLPLTNPCQSNCSAFGATCVVLDPEAMKLSCVCPSGILLDAFNPKCSDELPLFVMIVIAVACVVTMAIIGLLCMFLYTQYQRKHMQMLRRKMMSGPVVEGQLNRLRAMNINVNGVTMTEYNPNYEFGGGTCTLQDLREIPRDNLRLIKALGQGAFGEVYQGFYKKSSSDSIELSVAVKTLPELSSNQAEMDFLMEALIMSKFNHPNIVHFIGVCFEKHPRFIVLELLSGGDLKTFLRDSRPKPDRASPLVMRDLLLCAIDVAKGCEYLESNHFIHRDIAARNCLLTSKGPDRVAKIADFGMARDIYRGDYYRKGGKAMLPVKWMPPEAFLDGIFTSKTDVWSFGILLWEVMSLGYMPYPGRGNQEVMQLVTNGGRLEPPNYCPGPVYGLMCQCWHPIPEERPNFRTILERLGYCIQDPEVVMAPLPVFHRPMTSLENSRETSLSSGRGGGATTGSSADSGSGFSLPMRGTGIGGKGRPGHPVPRANMTPESPGTTVTLAGASSSDYLVPLAGMPTRPAGQLQQQLQQQPQSASRESIPASSPSDDVPASDNEDEELLLRRQSPPLNGEAETSFTCTAPTSTLTRRSGGYTSLPVVEGKVRHARRRRPSGSSSIKKLQNRSLSRSSINQVPPGSSSSSTSSCEAGAASTGTASARPPRSRLASPGHPLEPAIEPPRRTTSVIASSQQVEPAGPPCVLPLAPPPPRGYSDSSPSNKDELSPILPPLPPLPDEATRPMQDKLSLDVTSLRAQHRHLPYINMDQTPPVINNPAPYIIHASSASTTSSNGSTSRKKNNNEPPSEISV